MLFGFICSVVMWNWALLVLCAGVAAQNEEWREVNIAQGPLRGRITSEGGVYAFLNIPYATAPTGVDKFKAPLPAPVWTEMFDAVNRFVRCPIPGLEVIQEDCLVANVYVPDTDETNLPVVVHVHGGTYQFGFGEMRIFQTFVRTHKVIVVSFNYRLGAHGFLCLRTEKAPGNAGLKDQIALLRWVNANIASFGGNPNDVTIAGCSAGAGSIDFLTLSGATAGLFNKAILESGTSSGATGPQVDPIQNAKTFAELLDVDNVDDIASLEEFYTTASFAQLFSRMDVVANNENSKVLFSPCVEKDLGQETVITDTPLNIIRSGNYTKVPLLYGFANYDGTMRISSWDTWKDRMNEKFSDFLPIELHFDSETEKEEVAAIVKAFYFQNEPVSEQNIESYIHYFTDVLFGYPMLRGLKARVESLDDLIYLFEYSFVDSNTQGVLGTDLRGAQHCAQLFAVIDENETGATQEYLRMKSIMREYWFNFMSTGIPTVEDSTITSWTPASADRSPYMSLGSVIELKSERLMESRAAFWDDIYDQYYGGPSSAEPTDGAVSLLISYVALVAAVLVNILM